MKYEVDEELAAWLSAGTGANSHLFAGETARELVRQAAREALASPVGVDWSSRYGGNVDVTVPVKMAVERAESNPFYPSVPFRERVEECITDLLLDAPPAPVRKPGLNEYGVNLTIDRSQENPTPTKQQTGFAHGFNETIRTKGIAATKAKAGVVTLYLRGVPYDYSAHTADRLLNECISLGLIR